MGMGTINVEWARTAAAGQSLVAVRQSGPEAQEGRARARGRGGAGMVGHRNDEATVMTMDEMMMGDEMTQG